MLAHFSFLVEELGVQLAEFFAAAMLELSDVRSVGVLFFMAVHLQVQAS